MAQLGAELDTKIVYKPEISISCENEFWTPRIERSKVEVQEIYLVN